LNEKSDNSEDDDIDREHYRIKALVEMSNTNEQLGIIVYLLKLHYKFHLESREEGIDQVRTLADLYEDNILAVHTDEVWSKDSRHLVNNTLKPLLAPVRLPSYCGGFALISQLSRTRARALRLRQVLLCLSLCSGVCIR
jgi:hypothetical protein